MASSLLWPNEEHLLRADQSSATKALVAVTWNAKDVLGWHKRRAPNRSAEPRRTSSTVARPLGLRLESRRRRRLKDEGGSFPASVVERLVGGPELLQTRPVPVKLLVRCFSSGHSEDLAAYLNLGSGLSAKVERPRVGPFEAWSDVADDESSAIADVEQRDCSLQSCTATRGRQQEDWRAASERDPTAGRAVQPTLQRGEHPADHQDAEASAAHALSNAQKSVAEPHQVIIRRHAGRHQSRMSQTRCLASSGRVGACRAILRPCGHDRASARYPTVRPSGNRHICLPH